MLDADDFLDGEIASRRADKKAPAAKAEPPAKGHNNSNDAYNVTAEELRQFIERIEQLETEKKEIAEQAKEVLAEAKGRGYDTKVLKKLVALRRRKPDEIAEEEAVLEVYKSALGMS